MAFDKGELAIIKPSADDYNPETSVARIIEAFNEHSERSYDDTMELMNFLSRELYRTYQQGHKDCYENWIRNRK